MKKTGFENNTDTRYVSFSLLFFSVLLGKSLFSNKPVHFAHHSSRSMHGGVQIQTKMYEHTTLHEQ